LLKVDFFKVHTNEQLLANFLIHYSWESQRKILRVSLSNGRTIPYGYEYTSQVRKISNTGKKHFYTQKRQRKKLAVKGSDGIPNKENNQY